MKVSIRKETTLWNTFQDFLRNGEKKTELCIIIADAISQVCCQKTIMLQLKRKKCLTVLIEIVKILCPGIWKKQLQGYSVMYLMLVS